MRGIRGWLVLVLVVLFAVGVWLYFSLSKNVGQVTFEDNLIERGIKPVKEDSGMELEITHATMPGNPSVNQSILNKLLLEDFSGGTLQVGDSTISVVDIVVSGLLNGRPYTFKIPLIDKIFVPEGDGVGLKEISVGDIDYKVGSYVNISFFYVPEAVSVGVCDVIPVQGEMTSCYVAVELGFGSKPVAITEYLNSIQSEGSTVEIDPSVMVAVGYYD